MKTRTIISVLSVSCLLTLAACFHDSPIGPPSDRTSGITDDDNTTTSADIPLLTVTSSTNPDLTVSEGETSITFHAVLSKPSTEDIVFGYQVRDKTATRQKDFYLFNIGRDSSSSSETIPAGETEAYFTVYINNDAIDETNELFGVRLGLPTLGDGESPKAVLGTEDLTVQILDDDETPIVQLDANQMDSQITIREGAGAVQIYFSMPIKQSAQAVEIPLIISYPNSFAAVNGSDFEAPTVVVYPAADGETSNSTYVYNLPIRDDAIQEDSETFFVTLGTPLNGLAYLGPGMSSVTITIEDDDANGGINDTQVTSCANFDNYSLPCSNTTDFPGQDGDYIAPQNTSLVDVLGLPTTDPSQAACVKDLNTGLLWEIKTSSTTSSRYAQNQYTWYNPLENTNGGDMGLEGAGSFCGGTLDSCNTHAYLNYLNTSSDFGSSGLCGVKSWRLPKIHELASIMRFASFPGTDEVMFDENVFLDRQPGYYWTATPVSNFAPDAWVIYMGKTPIDSTREFITPYGKYDFAHVRAVTHF